MTLGTWFREYVYIPLGGNRVTTAKHIRNLLIVWGLTGVWHGAGINFLLWGLYYGVLLIIEKYLIGGFLKKHKVIGHTFTLIAVVIGWMLFANTSFASLGQYFCMMFGIGKVSSAHKYCFIGSWCSLFHADYVSARRADFCTLPKGKRSSSSVFIFTLYCSACLPDI